jgi:YVTN family beta-propeller protein
MADAESLKRLACTMPSQGDAESSRILKRQTCVLTEATKQLAASAVRTPTCGTCTLPVVPAPPPPYQDCSSSIPVGYYPSSIAISPDSLTAWVVNDGDDGGGSGISRINQLSNEVIHSFSVSALNEIAIDPSNSYVWITTNYQGVIRIDISNNVILPSIPVGNVLEGIAISPDNSTVWVANYYDNNVLYFNTVTFTPIFTIPVGQNPTQIVISSDGLFVYVLNTTDKSISVIYNYIVINTFTVVNYPTDLALSPDNSKLWITNGDTISVLNSSTGALLQTINILNPYSLAISPDYSSVWVTQNDSYTVSRIDATTYEIISTIPVGNYPTGIAINPDNSAVLIVNSYSDTVTKLYTPSQAPNFRVEGLPVPSGGSALLTLTILHGRAVDLTSYVQAADGSPLTFTLPLNLGGSVELAGSILTVYQTTPYLPITVTTPSSCTQEPGSMILNIILTVPAFTTPKESSYTLGKVNGCPLYILNQIPTNPCLTVAPNQGTFGQPSFSPTSLNPYPYVSTPPGALHQYRSIPRIRGIDQIATIVRGQSSSEATRRREVAVLRGHVASTNPFFRKPLPPLPCITRLVPQPPYPPDRPCRVKPL